jgi:hypothetical protein
MTDPAAPSDAVRAALERLRDGPLGEGSEDYEAGWKDGLDYAIALRLPAAAPPPTFDVVDGSDGHKAIIVDPAAAPVDVDWSLVAEAWGNVMDGRRVGGRDIAVRLSGRDTRPDDWRSIAAEYHRLAGQSSSQPVGGDRE